MVLGDQGPEHAGKLDKITQRINGDQNGAADRQTLYALALKVLA